MSTEVPVKLYLDKLLKDCRKVSVGLALISGSVKSRALHAVADRIAADEAMILAENVKDVEAVGKSFENADAKDRMKAAVARVRLTADQMKEIVRNEGSTAVRRAKLVNSFNDGYRGYRRTYRTCTSSATLAVTRFSVEGAQIAAALAKPSHYASRGSNDATPGSTTSATDAAPAPATGNAPAATDSAAPNPEAKPQTGASQGQAAAPEAGQIDGAEKPKRKKRKAANRTQPAETQQSIPFFGR